jgi:uncharacterized protein YaiL (DUF2058 family)
VSRKQKQGGLSLQDQLRQAGLITEKQVRRAEKGKHKKSMQLKHEQLVDEDKLAAQKAREEKTARDRQANLAREKKARQKALSAQIKQLVSTNSRLETGEVAYNFVEQKKVKKIYVSAANQLHLNKGFLAIVKIGDQYDLVPEKVAHKIMSRADDVVMYLYDRSKDEVDEDDPYKDFKIPDDLDW